MRKNTPIPLLLFVLPCRPHSLPSRNRNQCMHHCDPAQTNLPIHTNIKGTLWFTGVQIIDHFGGLKRIGESCELHSALSQWAASGLQTHTETVFPCKPAKLLSSQGVCFCLPLQMVRLRWAHGCFLSCDSQSICFSVCVFTVRFENYLQEFTAVCSFYRGNY